MKKRDLRLNRWGGIALVIVSLVGCVAPATGEADTAQPATATLAVIQVSLSVVLPSPTSPPATLTPPPPTSTPSPTPDPTFTPTLPPRPEPIVIKAELLPPPPVAPDGSVTAGGYTFSPLQEVPDGLGSVRIVGWLPGSLDEIVVTEGYRVIAINVYSGQVHKFSEPFDSPIRPERVLLLKNGKVVFRSYAPQLRQAANLWTSGTDAEQATEPVMTEAYHYPLVAPDGESLILYNVQTKQASILTNASLQELPILSQALAPLAVSRREGEYGWFHSVSSPASRWTAVFNMEHFSLVDLNTGESQEIDLGRLWTDAVHWSPDGQKLAMMAAEGGYGNLLFKKLLILDIESGQIGEVDVGFRYVTDAAWSPDSKHLLISADTGAAQSYQGAEYKTADLFWVDISSSQVQLISLLPEDTGMGFNWGLSWAPDGKKIAIGATFAPAGNPQLYRIDVSGP